MPPRQCPECGRFLKISFVASLPDAPAPCPGCETELRHEMFGVVEEAAPAGAAEAVTSVRPPDLVPDQVRDQPDVLSGWDPGVGTDLDAWTRDRPPFPTDAVVVAGAGLAGLLVGAAVGGSRRGPAAAVGATVGIVGASVARRIWRLDV